MAPKHIKLGEVEQTILNAHIRASVRNAISDHQERVDRFRRYWRMWRQMISPKREGEGHVSNFRIPLVAWQTAAKAAQITGAVMGEDAETSCKPHGETDQRMAMAVADYMDYYLWDHMDSEQDMMEIIHRTVLNGRSHALATYEVEADGDPEEQDYQEWYRGVKLTPLDPDDLILPAERRKSIRDFTWSCHRERLTPQQLLDGETAGKYYGIEKNWKRIMDTVKNGTSETYQNHEGGEQTIETKDLSEGVVRQWGLSNRSRLTVWNWYGKWRLAKKDGAEENDWARRDKRERHLVIRYIPDLQLIIGIQDLADIYQRMRWKVPILDFGLVIDGTYWSPGFGEMLEQMENEVSATHRTFDRAAKLNAAPTGFYRPMPGMEAETIEFEAGKLYPMENPKENINIVTFSADLSSSIALRDSILSYAERRTGQTDNAMGRAIDRPNAPRTAFQTAALIQQGDIRGALEISGIRKDFDRMLWQIWDLDCAFSDDQVQTFFRVTEEQARKWGGQWRDGRAALPGDARNGRYDFRLQFASSQQDREAKAMKALQRAQLDMANPLIVNNPLALWEVTRQYHEALGDKAFQSIIPQPAELDQPKTPKSELAMLQQRERIYVHPQDNHAWHKMQHSEQLNMLMSAPPDKRDVETIQNLAVHIAEHTRKEREQTLAVGAMNQVAQSVIGPMMQQAAAQEGGEVEQPIQ